MNKRHFAKMLFMLFVAALLVLSACGSDDNGEEEETDPTGGTDSEETEEETEEVTISVPEPDEDGAYNVDDFNATKTNLGDPIDGGDLNFGLVSDTAFEGTLNYNFYSGNPDVMIIEWFDEALLAIDESYNYTQEGAATWEVDEDNNQMTFTIRDNVNWHDGEPVKAEDWLYAYEVIGHADYDGIRYGSQFTIIEGMDEYHAGEADTISGIEVHDDKSMTITYNQFTPSLLASGVWPYALPKHIFEEIEVADMSSSDAVRRNPVGMGAFMVDSIVPGESVTMVKNEDYWRGEPNLDSVTVQVVNPNVVVQALSTGQVDMVNAFPTDQFPDNADMENVEFLAETEGAYTYIGFKLGSWDAEESVVVPDPDMKMSDVNLRRAMWHAVDNDAIGSRFYNGLRWNATTLIPPSHPDYHDDSIEAPLYDVDAANQILDDAGYEDVTGDGFREDPEGNELVINFASMSGGDIAEPLARYYIQSWEEVGLNVQLVDGRLMEFNTFYDRVEADDPDIDIYQGAWGVGSDVDPTGLYGRNASFNYTRYASEENDRLLELGVSEEAFDYAYRQDIYSQWQALMVEEIPAFPTVYRARMVPVNNRVVNYQMSIDTDNPLYRNDIGVTQDEPFTN